MTATQQSIRVVPVAYVRNNVLEPIYQGWREIVSEIVFEPHLAAALDGIEEFSHIQVLFWLHKVSRQRRATLKVHPRDREDLPLLGIFATRTQYRPNPIGSSTVELLERRDNVLVVGDLDAINGTPVLDVKPMDFHLQIEKPRLPDWTRRLREGR